MHRATLTSSEQEKNPSAFSSLLLALCRGLFIAAALLVLLLLPSLSHAFEAPQIRAKGGMAARADFDGADGSYKANRWGADVTWKQFYLEYDHTSYQWKDYKRMAFSRGHKPWDNLDFVRLGLRLDDDINDSGLGWFWDGGLVMGWEDEVRRSFGLAGSGGLSYQFSPELTGRLGVWGMAHPALFRLLPVASLDWNAPEEPGPSFSLGFPETVLRYRTEDRLAFRLGAKADMGERTYRLSDESHVYRKGYISTQGVTAGAYVDFSPLDGLTATFGLEYDMERKYEIRNNNGNRRQTIDVEDTPSLHFGVGYQF